MWVLVRGRVMCRLHRGHSNMPRCKPSKPCNQHKYKTFHPYHAPPQMQACLNKYLRMTMGRQGLADYPVPQWVVIVV